MGGIKGTYKELYVRKESIDILTIIGSAKRILYSDIKKINYCLPYGVFSGNICFITENDKKYYFEFGKNSSDLVKKAIRVINKNYPEIEFADNTAGTRKKIQGTLVVWGFFIIALFAYFYILENKPTKEAEVFSEISEDKTIDEQKNDSKDEVNTFYDGDIFEGDDITISHMGCGEYASDNMFIEPSEGNKFVYIDLSIHNISDSDISVGSADFTCYADDTEMSSAIVAAGDEMEIISTLSPDRYLKGKIYFEVPKGTQEIEVEYETSFWTQEKIFFVID